LSSWKAKKLAKITRAVARIQEPDLRGSHQGIVSINKIITVMA
jgi:hypothetical protein